jgi:hypothetical protein
LTESTGLRAALASDELAEVARPRVDVVGYRKAVGKSGYGDDVYVWRRIRENTGRRTEIDRGFSTENTFANR